jgi:hypothetical protein
MCLLLQYCTYHLMLKKLDILSRIVGVARNKRTCLLLIGHGSILGLSPSGTLTTGVNETSGKFAAGVKDNGGNLPPVSMTQAVNLQPVSTTPVANNWKNTRLLPP